MNFKLSGFLVLLFIAPSLMSQQVRVTGQDGANPITVAAPFLGFAPDSRGSAMGDLGVATSPDAFSIHWNNVYFTIINF